MHIYRGNFNFFHYVKSEAITAIVPTRFHSGEPIYFFWDWTTTPLGCSDRHFSDVGTIIIESIDNKPRIKVVFSHDDYRFGVTLGSKSLVLTPTLRDDTTVDPTPLHQIYSHRATGDTSALRIFTGSINCNHSQIGISAVDETFIIVAPKDIAHQEPLCALWQWSGLDGATKEDVDCVDQMRFVAGTGSMVFSYGYDYNFEGNLSSDGKQLGVVMEHSTFGILAHTVLQEVQPTPLLSSILLGETSTINNNTTNFVYCTFMETNNGVVDAILAGAGVLLGLAGFPGVISVAMKLVVAANKVESTGKVIGDAVGILGAAAGGSGAAQWGIGGENSTPGPLGPGDKKTRTSSGRPGTGNGVQIIRAYVKRYSARDRSIRIDSIEKSLPAGTTTLQSIINDTAATTNLLEFALPNPTDREKGLDFTVSSLTTFSNMIPHLFTSDALPTPYTKLDSVLGEGIYASPIYSETRAAPTYRSYTTLSERIGRAKAHFLDTNTTNESPKILDYSTTNDTLIAFLPHGTGTNQTEYTILPFATGGGVVLKFNNATIHRDSDGRHAHTATSISGENDTDNKIVNLIYNNPKTSSRSYHWVYWKKPATISDPSPNILYALEGETNAGLKYSTGQTIYVAASGGAKYFRHLVEVSDT